MSSFDKIVRVGMVNSHHYQNKAQLYRSVLDRPWGRCQGTCFQIGPKTPMRLV